MTEVPAASDGGAGCGGWIRQQAIDRVAEGEDTDNIKTDNVKAAGEWCSLVVFGLFVCWVLM